MTTLTALVPVMGPWRLLQSTRHNRREKRRLTWMSAALTGALVAAVILYLTTSRRSQRFASALKVKREGSTESSKASAPQRKISEAR